MAKDEDRHYLMDQIMSDMCYPEGSQAVKPLLSPIPVSGQFGGVDVVQLPMSAGGNRYTVVFMDYLTKWPEVYATKDQPPYTITKLLVEGVITRHGVPSMPLSDRGPALLSKLL